MMIDVLLALSLPALRSLSAIVRGARSDCDLRACGVSRSTTGAAAQELREHRLITTKVGRPASAGVRGIPSAHLTELTDVDLVDVSQLTLSQARVLIATRAQKYESTRELAKKCNLSEPSARDAIKFLFSKNIISEHTGNFQSSPQNFEAHCKTAPQEISQHPEVFLGTPQSFEATADVFKTELNTVSNSVKTTTKDVVATELIKAGVARQVAIELTNKYEAERILTVIKKSETAAGQNRAGYIFKALTLNYDFSRDNKKNIAPKTNIYNELKITELSIEQKISAQNDFDRYIAIFKPTTNMSH